MPIENRELAAGTRLVARYKKQDRTCEVVETADGLRYRLDDGTEHRSPSSAGKAAMDGVACNGWRFWSIEGTEKPTREPKAKADKPEKEPPAIAGMEKPKREPKAKADKPAKAKKEPAAKKPAKAKGAKTSKGKSAKKGKAMRAAVKGDASYGCGACGESFPTQKKAVAHALTHVGE
jgi:outer membrane biosynthesis protein TonB